MWVALGVALVSLATPLASETVRHKWFDFPQVLYLMLLPAATLTAGGWIWISLRKNDWKPFAGAVAIYVLAFAGLAYSLFSYVVMRSGEHTSELQSRLQLVFPPLLLT